MRDRERDGTLQCGVSVRGYVAYRHDINEFENGDRCLEAIDPDADGPVYIVTLGEDIPWWPSDPASE